MKKPKIKPILKEIQPKHKPLDSISPFASYYTYGLISIILATEQNRVHLSISHPKRYPTWDEIHYIRDKLTDPSKVFVMIMPPREYYVNIHKNCFHLWECGEMKDFVEKYS